MLSVRRLQKTTSKIPLPPTKHKTAQNINLYILQFGNKAHENMILGEMIIQKN